MQESEEARGWGLHASSCKTVVGCHSVLQKRRWLPFGARFACRSPVFGLFMAGCDGFAKVLQKEEGARLCKSGTGDHLPLQTRCCPPPAFAKPPLGAMGFYKPVLRRHLNLQSRHSPPFQTQFCHFRHSFERKRERKVRPLLARTDKRGKESIGSAELGPQKRRA